MLIADCHIHVFDADRFPFPSNAAYDPGPALGTRAGLLATAAEHGTTHALVVNAFRGSDHRQFLDLLRWGQGALRGIATLEADVTDQDLAEFELAGTVGQRFDLATVDLRNLTDTQNRHFLARLSERGWLAELQMNAKSDPELLAGVIAALQEAKLRMVIGHYSQPNPEMPADQPIFGTFMRLAGDGTSLVKLSSFFRHSRQGLPYADLDPYLGRVLDEFGAERCVWGSDWPFTRFPGHVTYGEEFATLRRWVPDARKRAAILWETPARVFRFEEGRRLTQLA